MIGAIDLDDPGSRELVEYLHALDPVSEQVFDSSQPVDLQDGGIDYRLRLASVPIDERFLADVERLMVIDDKEVFRSECEKIFEKLGDFEVYMFEKMFVMRMMDRLQAVAMQLPDLSESVFADENIECNRGVFRRVTVETTRLLDFFDCFVAAVKSFSDLSYSLLASLYHDQRGCLVELMGVFSDVEDRGWTGLVELSLRHKDLLIAIYKAHSSLVSGSFELSEVDPESVFETAAFRNATRFGLVVKKGAELDSRGFSQILGDYDDSPKLFINFESIVLALYNYIKNAAQIGKVFLYNCTREGGDLEKLRHLLKEDVSGTEDELRDLESYHNPISMKFSIRSFGENCVEISIVDTGAGVSYDERRDEVTMVALEKQRRGLALNRLEGVLLDGCLRDHVPPVALNRSLFDKGVSVGSIKFCTGGTGVGLEIVRAIARAHQGVATIGTDVEYGAVASIILPNIRNTDPAERREVLLKDLQLVFSDGAKRVLMMVS